ncbi:hypothetical protein D3C87_1992080 [compost metagenome]
MDLSYVVRIIYLNGIWIIFLDCATVINYLQLTINPEGNRNPDLFNCGSKKFHIIM